MYKDNIEVTKHYISLDTQDTHSPLTEGSDHVQQLLYWKMCLLVLVRCRVAGGVSEQATMVEGISVA